MTLVRITGWKPGLRKVSHTEALRVYAGLSLSEAKAATDRVLDGFVVEFEIESDAEVERAVSHLRELGAPVECSVVQSGEPNLSFKRTPGGAA